MQPSYRIDNYWELTSQILTNMAQSHILLNFICGRAGVEGNHVKSKHRWINIPSIGPEALPPGLTKSRKSISQRPYFMNLQLSRWVCAGKSRADLWECRWSHKSLRARLLFLRRRIKVNSQESPRGTKQPCDAPLQPGRHSLTSQCVIGKSLKRPSKSFWEPQVRQPLKSFSVRITRVMLNTQTQSRPHRDANMQWVSIQFSN